MNLTGERKKPNIKMIIIISIIVLILIGTGIFLFLFLKTDKLKSNEELFWKYMGQNLEMTDMLKYQKEERFEGSYIEDVKLQFDIPEFCIQNLEATINTKKDAETQKTYSKIDAMFNGEKLFDLEYLRNEDLYALKNTEVANGYIAIKNEDLKALVEKIGMDNSEIPDKITEPNYSNLLTISNEEKEHIKDTYYDVIKKNIDKKKYTKKERAAVDIEDKTYTANAYSVTLTEKEFQNLMISILETLKTDSITLNLISTKMKTINKDSKYASVNQMNEEISKTIEQLKQKEVLDKDYLTITVYESNGKTISTKIDIIDNTKISISYIADQNKIVLKQESVQENRKNWKEITFINRNNQQEEYILLNILMENDEKITCEIKKEKSEASYKITGSIDVLENRIEIDGRREISQPTDIPNIKDSTNIVLNNLQKEKLQLLMTKLEEQIGTVIKEKRDKLTPTTVQEPKIEEIQDIL